MIQKSEHLPVMKTECLQFFADCDLKVFFDGTLGAAGHAQALLSTHPEIELYIACDQDPDALQIGRENLNKWKDKVKFEKGNFENLDQFLKKWRIRKVDGFFF